MKDIEVGMEIRFNRFIGYVESVELVESKKCYEYPRYHIKLHYGKILKIKADCHTVKQVTKDIQRARNGRKKREPYIQYVPPFIPITFERITHYMNGLVYYKDGSWICDKCDNINPIKKRSKKKNRCLNCLTIKGEYCL